MSETKLILIESVGAWPEYVLDDISNVRTKLIYAGHWLLDGVCNTPKAYASERTSKSLDYQFHKTAVTYNQFLKNNDLAEFIMDKTLEDDVVLVILNNTHVQINGVKLNWTKNCAFCPNEFKLHKEAVKLKDKRLICDDCYTNVFDSVLNSSTLRREEKWRKINET